MLNKRRSKIFVLFLFTFSIVSAQSIDTIGFKERDFLRQLLQNSPAAQNSQLFMDMQDAEYREARAAFEPKLAGDFGAKQFDSKEYYNKFQSGLKVQTPFGINVNGGYENNNGQFLNPENNVPAQGLAYVGIEVPLGSGLFTDSDRALVKQRKVERDAASLVFNLEMNDYTLEAGTVFWQWYGEILKLELSQEAVRRATNRFNFVKSKNRIGEAAGIDTLESFINLQNRQNYNYDIQVKWFKISSYLKNYIWDSTAINKPVAPIADREYDALVLDTFYNQELLAQHPLLLMLEVDSTVNTIDYRLAKEFLKPQVDLALKLQEAGNELGEGSYDPANNNFVGFNIYMPLLMRKQRAKMRQLEYKNDMIANKRSELEVKLNNNINISQTNSSTLKLNMEMLRVASANYKALLDAEITKFRLGESSVFMVNSRELKWIQAREKYIKAYVDFRIEILKYYHSLGVLNQLVLE
jgi:outer membrane protein TolC